MLGITFKDSVRLLDPSNPFRCASPVMATSLNEQVRRVISHAHVGLSEAPIPPSNPSQSTATQYNSIRPEPSIPPPVSQPVIHASTPSRWVCDTNLIYECSAVDCHIGRSPKPMMFLGRIFAVGGSANVRGWSGSGPDDLPHNFSFFFLKGRS